MTVPSSVSLPSPRVGAVLFITGVTAFVLAALLSLYSVPGPSIGSPPVVLPSFPLLEMEFPLIPLLLALSPALMASGWFLMRCPAVPIILLSVSLVALGIATYVLNFVYGVSYKVGGATAYIAPYGSQAAEPFIVGLYLGLLSTVFYWLEAFRQRRMSTT